MVTQGSVNPGSPTYTVTYTQHSPAFTVSPLPGISLLPTPFSVPSPQSACNSFPPSPVTPGLHVTTLFVTPLLALDQSFGYDKVCYDVSKDPSIARVSTVHGQSVPITREQRHSLVVEGALVSPFHIAFDHPALTRTIELQGIPTVDEFLRELHSYFLERVGTGEMRDLQGDRDYHPSAVRAQKKRCDAASDPDREWRRGMRRVDILGKGSKLRGIYLDSSPTDITLRVVFGK